MILGKKLLGGAAGAALILASISIASAQMATFSYNDGNGTPNAGTYSPGSNIDFDINLAFTAGGNISNLSGLSYWFEDRGPNASAPYYFAITLRNASGGPFTFLQTDPLSYPQNLTPQNASDLGGGTQSGSLGNGSYFVAHLTISISASATPGTYVLENTTSPSNKVSLISDSNGHTFAIPQAQYMVTIVPEPGALALILAGLSLLGAITIRHRN